MHYALRIIYYLCNQIRKKCIRTRTYLALLLVFDCIKQPGVMMCASRLAIAKSKSLSHFRSVKGSFN